MIDTTSETLLTVKDVARRYPGRTGKGLNYATVWRWIQRGVAGVRLEIVCVGGQTYTSKEALERFQHHIAVAKNRPTFKKSNDDVNKRIKKADDEAESLGF